MGFLDDLLAPITSTFDPKYGWLGRPVSGALRSGIDLTRALPRQLGPVFTPWLDPKNFEENPDVTRFLDEYLGGGFAEKMRDEPVKQVAESMIPGSDFSNVPFEEILRNAIFPEMTAADVAPTIFGKPKTQEEIQGTANLLNQLGGAAESIVNIATDPTNLAIPAVPGIGAAFIPGIAESLGTNLANEEYGRALVDALFGGLVSAHTAKAAKGVEKVTEPPMRNLAPGEGFRVPESERVLDSAPLSTTGDVTSELIDRASWGPDYFKSPRDYDIRLVNMIDAYLKRIEPEVGRVLADVKPRDIFIEISRDPKLVPEGAAFDRELNTMYINPDKFADMLPRKISKTILHELAHTRESHSLKERRPLTSEIPAETPPELIEHTWENIEANAKLNPIEAKFKTGQDILFNNPEIGRISNMFERNVGNLNAVEFRRRRGLPTFEQEGETLPELQAAPKDTSLQPPTYTIKNGIKFKVIETGKVKPDTFGVEGRDFLHQVIYEPVEGGSSHLGWMPNSELELRRAESSAIPIEAKVIDSAPKSEKVVSEPANILRKILQETKLTKFNRNTLVRDLEAKGVPVPDEIKNSLPELLGELKDRGWINEKVGGAYTLLVEPPKRITELQKGEETEPVVDLEAQLKASLEKGGKKEVATEKPTTPPTPTTKPPSLEETMKEKLTDDEIRAIGNIFGGVKPKPKPKPKVAPEIEAAQKAALEGGAKKPPEKPTLSETVEEEGTKKPFEVTLSDGTTHKVKAESPEAAKLAAEKVLSDYGSTKVVDKVEESLTSLQRAAKYEIEPVREGTELVSEDVKEAKGILSEEVKLGKEEEKLRKAQTKEKFQKKTYVVNLSNGRTTTIKARNEARAREYVEAKIKQTKPGITITSVAEKPSALEAAITGVGKKIEESNFLKNPIVRTLNAVKSLAFGGDVGHLLRQGKQMNSDLLFSKHAKKVLEQIPVIIKAAKSQEFFDKFHENLYSDPTIKMMVDDFNLDMPGLGEHLKEEVFHGGGLAEKIPVVGKYYAKPSERAYTSGLNFLRAAEVKKLTDNLQKKGLTPDNAPEKYEAVARAVNIISQRGDFNPAWKKLFSDASAIYGAPRAKAARLQNAAELFRGGTSGDIVRTTAAKTMAFNASLYGLLAATTGAQFITDPERSDFGKFRINDKISIDPWVGLGVTARTVAKLQTSKSVSPYTGKSRDIAPSEAVTQELLGGLAPGVKLLWEVYSGKDVRGYQVDRIKALLNVAPLTAKNVVELLQTGDIEDALLLSMLQIGGEGVDVFNYERAKEQERKLKEERGLVKTKKKKRTYVN